VITLGPWFNRTWTFEMPVGAFPGVVERLRGTPARAAELVAGTADDQLRRHAPGAWSAKRHLGHLDDLHELDDRRLGEFLSGATSLTAADPANRRTHETDHDATPAAAIVARLRAHRAELVTRLETLTEEAIAATAVHPRLHRPLRLIDWAFFVAEHDDHHLAAARQALAMTISRSIRT
jgi:DinB family protein